MKGEINSLIILNCGIDELQSLTKAIPNKGFSGNLNDITINKRLGNLTDRCSEMPYVSYCQTLQASVKPRPSDNLLIKDKKNDMIEKTRHKKTHLQTVQANALPKFAKDLFFCRRTIKI